MEDTNRPIIYTFGDSHCWHGWLQLKGVKTLCLGPMTMHHWGIHNPFVTDDERIPKDRDCILCFSAGEIDCRNHVHKYQPWKKTIDELVEGYLKTIRNNVVGRNVKNVWIYNVVPPIRSSEVLSESPSYPFVGTDVERVEYVRYMNKKLKESEFVFVDIYDKYSDSDGFMIFNYSDGHCHILNATFLKEWIDNYFKNND